MKILHITDQTQWEGFIDENGITTFMQSWAWGEFETKSGNEVFRCMVEDENRIVAAVQIILVHSKRGTFLYIPHGPIFHRDLIPWSNWTDTTYSGPPHFGAIEKIYKSIHRELLQIGDKHKCSFIRINSSLPKNSHFEELLQQFGYRIAPIYLASENAAVLSLAGQDTKTLLANMRKTTRYLIHKAEKEGVSVTVDQDGSQIAQFLKLYTVTTNREKFVGFSDRYIKNEFEAFGQYGNAVILNATYEGDTLASAILLFTKNSAFYHQGASNHPKVPAPYLLQWRAIQLALERGCRFYNFWGTYILGRTPKGWQGLSLFKTGFGTQIWNYVPTYDFPLKSTQYLLTSTYEHLLRLKRGV